MGRVGARIGDVDASDAVRSEGRGLAPGVTKFFGFARVRSFEGDGVRERSLGREEFATRTSGPSRQ